MHLIFVLSLLLASVAPVSLAETKPDTWPALPSRLHLNTPYGDLKVSQSDYVYESLLLLNGQETQPAIKGLLNIPYAFSTPDYDVALIAINTGSSNCPVSYKWVLLDQNGYDISPEFGSCSEQIRVTADKQEFTLQTPNAENPDRIDTYVFDGEDITTPKLTGS